MATESYQFIYHHEFTPGLSRKAFELQRAKERSHAARVSHARIKFRGEREKNTSASCQCQVSALNPQGSEAQKKVVHSCDDHVHPYTSSVARVGLHESPGVRRAPNHVEPATSYPVDTSLLDPFVRLPVKLSMKDRNVLHFCKYKLPRFYYTKN